MTAVANLELPAGVVLLICDRCGVHVRADAATRARWRSWRLGGQCEETDREGARCPGRFIPYDPKRARRGRVAVKYL